MGPGAHRDEVAARLAHQKSTRCNGEPRSTAVGTEGSRQHPGEPFHLVSAHKCGKPLVIPQLGASGSAPALGAVI